jgi:hypothetical protein
MLELGLINNDQLHVALEYGKSCQVKLGQSLVANRFISEKQLKMVLSSHLGVPAIDLSTVSVTEAMLKTIPKDLAIRHELFPLGVERNGGRTMLKVAMADPMNMQAIAEVEFATGSKVKAALAEQTQLMAMVRQHYLNHGAGPLHGLEQRQSIEFNQMHNVYPEETELMDESAPGTANPAQLGGAIPLSADLPAAAQAASQGTEERLREMELKFKALLRVMLRKELISREEFISELQSLYMG